MKDLSWKQQRPPTSWRPLPGRYLVSRNELGDHAEWTKLVFVLNIKSMHQSPIGSESHLIRFRAGQGVRGGAQGDAARHSAQEPAKCAPEERLALA